MHEDLVGEGGAMRGSVGLDDPVLGRDAPRLESLLQTADGVARVIVHVVVVEVPLHAERGRPVVAQPPLVEGRAQVCQP